MRYRGWDKTEHPVSKRTATFAVQARPPPDRDTIVLSAGRYTAYDWHARSFATYMYADILYIVLLLFFLFAVSLCREGSLVERCLARSREDRSRAIEKEADKLTSRFPH